jgi:hypothetical protein
MTFNGAATKGAQILIYADPEGASATFSVGSYDDPCDSADIDVDAGHQVNGFIPVLREPKYIKAVVKNLDTAQSITGISVWSQVQKP